MPRRSRAATVSGPRWRTAPGLAASAPATDPTTEADTNSRGGGGTRATSATGGTELAAPQVRLDREMPRLRSPTGSEVAAGSRTARGALTHQDPDPGFFARSIRSLEPISDLEATAFAGRFAADFQSFDEDEPSRRAEVLRLLFADPRASTWGWSGEGRQRADAPLPGRIFRTSDTVVFVEVLVRATTYARTRPQPAPVDAPDPGGVEPVGFVAPSSAPPESDLRWIATETNWLRMTVPVTRSADDGRLVVDPHLVPDQSA
jgi:hypothetical protein